MTFAKFAALLVSAGIGLINGTAGDTACCYFSAKDKDVNQPGQKAFISWNPEQKMEAFTVQPKFEGNAADFGMVIPTPSRPKLDEMPRDFFKDLAMYTILLPLPQPIYLRPFAVRSRSMGSARFNFGAGGILLEKSQRDGVRVLESGVVGSLDYKIIVAENSKGLFDWLKSNKYSYSGDESTLSFYIKKKWFFTVMKIDPKQMKTSADGSYLGEVTPTRFTFSSSQCIYPLKITQISVKDKTDALFYVQSPEQMDLSGDWSWMHSYRPMYLTYMLGCAVDPQQQQELSTRNDWLQNKRRSDPQYETTKLEWAKKLNDADARVLEDPLANYSLVGEENLPPGAKVISLRQFLDEAKAEYLKDEKILSQVSKAELTRFEDMYQPAKGSIVKMDAVSIPSRKGRVAYFGSSPYMWYPARQVPLEDVKGLTRLKGHLQKGHWLTKFRKIMRKDEMTEDIVLANVGKNEQQTYLRIMPTSPP